MANITLRSTTSATDPGSTSSKGDDLSFVEVDSNFILINNEVGTKIEAVVDDTTPQLGGSLDVNSQSIVTASNGNITLDPNGTGITNVDGDGTTPSNFPERLTRLQKGDLTIDSNQTNAWWGSQIILKDNTDEVFAMVGRVNTSGKSYGYAIITDPNGTELNTSAYAGDYGFYFNMTYEQGAGSDEWIMYQNVYGADDGYHIQAYGSNHVSYARTPLILHGSTTTLAGDGTDGLTVDSSGDTELRQLKTITDQTVVGTGAKTDEGYLEVTINGATRYIPYYS